MARNFNGTTSVMGVLLGSAGATFGSVLAKPFSLAAWIRPLNLGENSSGNIISWQNAGGGGTGYWSFVMLKPSTMKFEIDFTGANPAATATDGTINTGGVWQHVAMTWDGVGSATAGMRLYRNGVEVSYATRATSLTFVVNTHQSLSIGNARGQAGTFNGDIAHVYFFGRELQSGEVIQLMNHPGSIGAAGSVTTIGTSGEVGYWPMSGFTGANVGDFSGNMRAGTMTAMVTGSTEPPVNEQFLIGYPCGALAM